MREHIVDVVTMGAVILVILVYFVLDLLEIQRFEIPDAIVLFLLAGISLYIITMGYKNEHSFEKINTTLDETKKDTEDSKHKFGEINDAYKAQGEANEWMIDRINEIKTELKDIKKESTATVRQLDSQEEFYRVLNDRVLSATSKVWLMHLDPHAPDSDFYKDDARTSYFKNCAAKAKAQNGVNNPVEFRRIINIPTEGKLEWTEKLIQETNDLKNLHLAYIHINDIEGSFPISVASCQIIDNRTVFLLNPTLNVVPEGTFKTCIIIENEQVVAVYKEYYEKIWNLLEAKNSKRGCVIKNGPGTTLFEKNKQMILDNINKSTMEQKEAALTG